ncbi:MAG: redoxin domain-containing protein [Desulfuromonadaceae bacterium]|nr:redoxin domain-containing protein [Desulfuromonadaceae bacterium]MDD5106326.1 redoxin domain-containing protein [Desulfuromonadaceae bacterium]
MYSFRIAGLLLLVIVLTGCGDNLFPSGEDKRPSLQAGDSGGGVTQKSPDFSISDSNGVPVTLASSTFGKKAAVFYFTMWCPICDSHMNNMRAYIVPAFPDVNFFLVDYVSGSISAAARAAAENGYAGGTFTTLADISRFLLNTFQATMGTTVVIDNTGVIKMNEDYRDGTNLRIILTDLP